MEAVVFVGGVSLGQPATSIPIAAIVGLICGLVCGFLIYTFASRTSEYSLVAESYCAVWLIFSCSSHRLLDRHDKLPPPHRRRSLQPCSRLIPRKRLQPPVGLHDLFFSTPITLVHSGLVRMLTMLERLETDPVPTMSAVTSGTWTAATPRATSTLTDGKSSTPSSAGRTVPRSAPSSDTSSTGLQLLSLSS